MSVPRGFILVILLYVALDLSLAAMPGAFVFDVSDSVESVQAARLRPVADTTLECVAPSDAGARIVRTAVMHRPLPRPLLALQIRPGDSSRSKTPEPPRLSEDPH